MGVERLRGNLLHFRESSPKKGATFRILVVRVSLLRIGLNEDTFVSWFACSMFACSLLRGSDSFRVTAVSVLLLSFLFSDGEKLCGLRDDFCLFAKTNTQESSGLFTATVNCCKRTSEVFGQGGWEIGSADSRI